MHSFLKAEWKTILGVFLFCGSIFSWFYYQEVKNAEAAAAPYVYECLNPGTSFLNYSLGTPLEALKPQLSDFTETRDATLDLVRYQRKDGALALNFFSNRLASIEYYPDRTESDVKCSADIAMLSEQQPSALIVNGERRHLLSDGFVRVTEVPPVSEETPKENTEKTVAWFIIPKH